MTRETKIGLLAGLSIILLIGIIVSDFLAVPAQEAPPAVTQLADTAQRNIYARPQLPIPASQTQQTQAPPQRQSVIPTPLEIDRSMQATQGQTPLVQNVLTLGGEALPVQRVEPIAETSAIPQPRVEQVASSGRPQTGPVSPPVEQPKTVTVRTGDTLSSLAARHLGSADRYDQLYRANRDQLNSPNEITVGMVLRLPGSTAAPTAGVVTERPAVAASTQTYAVRSGDTLASIARSKLGSAERWQQLYADNRRVIGDDPDALQVGQVLRIPQR